jgi:hypothetical protein
MSNEMMNRLPSKPFIINVAKEHVQDDEIWTQALLSDIPLCSRNLSSSRFLES